jgi:hypothetical protein
VAVHREPCLVKRRSDGESFYSGNLLIFKPEGRGLVFPDLYDGMTGDLVHAAKVHFSLIC